MKHTLLIFLLSLTLIACNRIKQVTEVSKTGVFYPEVEQRSVIIGKITNINEFSNAPRVIELCVDDITINHQHSFGTEIDDSGKFIFDIPLYHPINTYLNYGDGRITPFLFPNDTVFLNCQIGKMGFQTGIVSGEFDEKHNKFQNEFFSLTRWIHYEQLNPFRNNLPKDLAPLEIKSRYLDFKESLMEIIENRIVVGSLNDTLANYLRHSATYSIFNDIIRFATDFKTIDEKQEFFSFLTDSMVFNHDAMITSDYISFLNNYHFNVEPRKSVSIVNVASKEQLQYELLMEIIRQNSGLRNGVWAEFLNASSLFALAFREEELTLSLIAQYSELIQEGFSDPYIRQLLLSMCNKISQKVEEIAQLAIPDEAKLNIYDSISGEELFNNILDANNGKVIYVDFWATWCSPCKQQIPHSLRIHEMLKDKDVVFMYLCCSSEQETWKKVIQQYQIKGDHILLNDNQYNYFKNKFSILGIPRYILIDKAGDIVDPDAPMPASEEILEMIGELIN